MAAKEKELNPYASPVASDAPDVSGPRPRFRWRVIGGMLLYLYGGSVLLLGLLELAFCVALFTYPFPLSHRALRRRHIPVLGLFVDSVLGVLAGCLLLVAARVCWKGGKARWRRAGVLALFGFGLWYGLLPLKHWIFR